MNSQSLTKEIDWFCYHAAKEGLLDRATCISVIEAIEDAGAQVTLDQFIQVLTDNGLCSADKCAHYRKMSMDEAKIFGFPQHSVFDESKPKPEPAAAEQPPKPAAPPSPAKTEAKANSDESEETKGGHVHFESHAGRSPSIRGESWLEGWPDLSQAQSAGAEGAQKMLDDFLHKARAAGCSDVHLSAGAYPFVRRYKKIYLVPGQLEMSPENSEILSLPHLAEHHRQQFLEHHDLDYCYDIGENDRYRANLMQQRLGISASYRIIDSKMPVISELGFHEPSVIEKLTTHNQGLILVTGPAGCGKSTTLNAMINFINQTRCDHIVTVEDPIEVVHVPQKCNITQRELHRHTKSFANALRAVLREDPDVIVIGELRDLETIEMAIHASETGHLVFGTLHTSSAPSTMDRILDVFPPNQQSQIRSMVAESMKAVICQQLLPNADGTGVVMAAEILLNTLAVSNLIREGKTYQINSTLQTNRNMGMSTMEQSLLDLYLAGKRTFEQTIPSLKTAELIRQAQARKAQEFMQGKK
jgi:twitching motility protein PilT